MKKPTDEMAEVFERLASLVGSSIRLKTELSEVVCLLQGVEIRRSVYLRLPSTGGTDICALHSLSVVSNGTSRDVDISHTWCDGRGGGAFCRVAER